MNVLITGAGGFIGTYLFKSLENKHNVYGISEINEELNSKIFNCDLLNYEQTLLTLSENKIKEVDVVIHLASVMASGNNLNDIEVLNKNNSLSFNVASLSKHLKAKKVINFSSSSVYPNIDGEFSEDSEINPSLNADAIYGLSKFNSEILLSKFCSAETIVTHLRCVMVYGEGVNKTRIWPVMEKELSDKNTITVFGNGKRLINHIHINELCSVVDKFTNKDYPGIFNISSETISLKDLALRIIKERGNSDSKLVEIDKGNTFQFMLKTAKLKNLQ